ncbi:MAG: hypothetical protein DLM72_06030 [Candidatus Nitrosopolaris wilkensis]|nr:MAG: hypothetical protein DLM72_06030 [Candidatus Nitrosopolaris wilkensis]
MKLNNSSVSALAIVLLLISSLAIVASDGMLLGQAKKSSTTTKAGNAGVGSGGAGGGFAEQPPIGTEPLTPATANNSAAAIAIAHRLAITSVNSSKSNGGPCLPQLNHFILPLKEARFTVIKQCVTVTGRVVWTNYFNNDGDANFNVVLDPPYKNMLGPGSYSQVFASKYPEGPAMHLETVCQGPVTSKSKENVGACYAYNGPDFRTVLPKIGQHVMVTGRYLIEVPEMPGGITELHPVYAIKILP